MITPEQIKKWEALFPEHASSSDETIIQLITNICTRLKAQAKSAAAATAAANDDDDDNDDDNGNVLVRTRSQSAPSQAELIVNAMSQESRENFLRDFAQTAPDLPGCRADGVSSDPGPHVEEDLFMSDNTPSSR